MRPAGDVVGFALLMGIGVGVMFAYYSTVYSTIHDVVEPSLRGTAMALYFFAMYVLGASMGPVGTGLASDYFTFQKASAAGAVAPGILDPEVGINLMRMLHGSQEFVWGEPVCAGDAIETKATLKDLYEKDGREYYVFESVSRNQDGQEVVRGTWTNIVR